MRHQMRFAVKVLLSFMMILVVLAGALLGGCGKETPASTKTVTVVSFFDYSGPTSAPNLVSISYIEAVFKYLNDVQGGYDVGGGDKVKVRFVQRDHRADLATATGQYRDMAQNLHPDLIFWGTEWVMSGVKDEIAQNKTPVISTSGTIRDLYIPAGWIFCLRGDMDMITGFYRWVIDDWTGAEKPKVGVLLMDNPWGYAKRESYEWANEQGIEILERTYAYTSMDFAPQLLSLRDAGVDYIFADVMGTHASLFVRDARAMGNFQDRVKIVFGPNFRSTELIGLKGSKVQGFYGMTYDNPLSGWAGEGPELYNKMMDWSGLTPKSDSRTELFFYLVTKNAVERAVKNVGIDNLDTQAIYDALNTFGKLDMMDEQNITFSPSKRMNPDTVKIAEFSEEGFINPTDWIPLARITEGEG